MKVIIIIIIIIVIIIVIIVKDYRAIKKLMTSAK